MRLLLLIFAISCATALEIKFEDCGNGELKSIDITPCNSEPCEFSPGDKVKVTAKAVPNHDSKKADISATVNNLPYSDFERNGCNVVECPLEKGKEYNVVMEIKVPDKIPGIPVFTERIAANVKVEVHGDNKILLGCAKAKGFLKPKSIIPPFKNPFGKK